MKKTPHMLLGFFIASLTLLAATQAFADRSITIINDRYKTTYTAVRYQDYREGNDGGVWTTEAWYAVKPWQTRTIRFATDTDIMYVYTYEDGTRTVWAGNPNDSRDNSYWISHKKLYLQGTTKPRDSGAKMVRFKRYHVRKNGLSIRYK